MFIIAPAIGILTALVAVVAEQLLAVIVNIFFQTEITSAVYTNLTFFLIAAAAVEESSKYLSISYVLRKIYGLEKYRLVVSAVIAGLFFGLTEVYFVLLANGHKVTDLARLGGETIFSLAGVLILHGLTTFLMAAFIVSQDAETGLKWPKVLAIPIFVHLLFNFLVIEKSGFTNWLIGIVFSITFLTAATVLAFNRQKLD